MASLQDIIKFFLPKSQKRFNCARASKSSLEKEELALEKE